MITPARIFVLAAALMAAGRGDCGQARPPGRPHPSGHEYVRLAVWARANEFGVRWPNREKTVELSNRWALLTFNLDPRQDSRRARVNGVDVWLAFPLLYQNGAAYISQTDLSDTLGPVLSPPENPPGIKIKTICLDPGHGGKDPGYQIGPNDEKKFTLLLAQETRDLLTGAGFNVVLTRSSDTSLKLPDRTEIARRRKADLFVSLHFNSAGGQHSEVRGIEVYCLTPEGAFSTNAGGEGDSRWCPGNRHNEKNMLLAYRMEASLVKTLAAEDRGVHHARFEVLRDAAMPAILIEGGFMSNPPEGRKIFDPAYRHQMARAITDGILAYKRQVKG